ncbi:fungal trichothecene efflux pump [Penicillium macrosclerotiorum]|uniref:fungal trichothecene efflux pump n=1 Tax=Penicillium macrosclerotiorum TaxID=303699 RepID=UPI002548573E|nr:fungal trichothecene efflux pump [Penicillium macrosclerotiorum]KAJ5676109.1 fungal trichothecene efflux pump [Penicillium macrosclerotiorum]
MNRKVNDQKPSDDVANEHIEQICGDAESHDKENDDLEALERSHSKQIKLSNVTFLMVLVGFCMAFVGSQVISLIFAALVTTVANDLNAVDDLVWIFSAGLVSISAVAPFAGPVADLFGRKSVTIVGVLASMLGMILCAATPNGKGFIAGQAISGVGVGIQELMSISAVAELVPTYQRGFYAALVVSAFLPFAPASLYGELIAQYSWRYCACLIAIWNLLTALVLAIFYNPAPRVNAMGLSRMEMLRRIDFLGGFLMIAGVVVFLIGLNWGGKTYPWNSSAVLSCLILGAILVVAFFLYETLWAKYPMFPRRLLLHSRAFVALMVVILVAGINYIPILFFWVMQSISIYGSGHVQAGIRTLPFGFCIVGGSLISAIMISSFKGYLRPIMTSFCVLQAVAIGCMAAVDRNNINTVWAPLVLGLTGVGGVLVPNQVIVTVISPDDLIATATSLTVCLRSVGQVVGISIFYTQFIAKLTEEAETKIVPAAIKIGITDPLTLKTMPSTLLAIPFSEYAAALPQLKRPESYEFLHQVVISAFGVSFSKVYLISIAFGATACIASWFLGDLTSLMDDHIAVSYF